MSNDLQLYRVSGLESRTYSKGDETVEMRQHVPLFGVALRDGDFVAGHAEVCDGLPFLTRSRSKQEPVAIAKRQPVEEPAGSEEADAEEAEPLDDEPVYKDEEADDDEAGDEDEDEDE